MAAGDDSPALGRATGPMAGPTSGHALGPHVVGRRIVVRRVLRGERGPTGGPAFTDVRGICTSWHEDACVVETDAGPQRIPVADIVAGRPIPPRPVVRGRVPPREIHLLTLSMWSGVEREELGEWVLRSGGRDTGGRPIARANSALAMGDPARPLEEAAARVREFYAVRDRPAWAQVVVGSDVDRGLTRLGWTDARPGERESLFQVAAVSAVRRRLPAAGPDLELAEDGDRAIAALADRARGRAAVTADWVGIHDVWTDPEARRQGLAGRILAGLLDWAADRGARTAYLQVRADNLVAIALYEGLGFATHHAYRYLAAPGGTALRREHGDDPQVESDRR